MAEWELNQSAAAVPQLSLLIRRAQQAQTRIWSVEVGEGVTPPQAAVIRAVKERPNLDQTLVSKMAFLDRSTVTQVVNRLMHRGYLRRRRDATDQRRNLLRLTPAGDELHAALRSQAARVNLQLFALLEPEKRQQFLDLLTEFVERAEAQFDCPPDNRAETFPEPTRTT